MELKVSGNAMKTFVRSIHCLSKIGNQLSVHPSSSHLAFYTLNSSRSAYQSITFKPDFFDVYTLVSGSQLQFSVLLKAVCAVLRTPLSSIDYLRVNLLDPDAGRVKWTLDCLNGMKKTYWINCNTDPEIQHLSLDKGKFQSNFAVRPRDLNRLLSNFQSSLHEITIIATEPSSLPSDALNEIGGKAVEIRSYIDPTNDNGNSLHTQLWIDPMEEFLQYAHTGNPVDVTFGVKELKAFLSYCEACEANIHLFFEKAGEPILLTPKFGIDDDGSTSNFDAKLVLATMLTSQLTDMNTHGEPNHEVETEPQEGRSKAPESSHTKIWSDLSASAPKSGSGSGGGGSQEMNVNSSEQRELQNFSGMQISKDAPIAQDVHGAPNLSRRMYTTSQREEDGGSKEKGQGLSQHYRSNWVDADEDEDEGEDTDLCVQSTPPYYEEQ